MSEINNIANQITNISPEFGNKPNITTDSDSGNFSNAIGKFLNAVSQDQMKAKEAVSDIVTGKSENLHEAMAKVEESKLSFELMLEVRNKLIDAYKEIQRMFIRINVKYGISTALVKRFRKIVSTRGREHYAPSTLCEKVEKNRFHTG